MSAPCTAACSPWATVDDLCAPCTAEGFDTAIVEPFLPIASDILFILSGQRFPGSCQDVIRPHHQCTCPQFRTCYCSPPSALNLGEYPITQIDSVWLNGALLDPSEYRVDDFRWLVRLPDANNRRQFWPCCPRLDLPRTEDNTLEVTFTYGTPPPPAGVHAAASLACQLALACNPDSGGECRLPKHVQSITRQGISMVLLDPFDFFEAGKVGVYEVDLFLSTYNPHRLRRSSAVISPDTIGRVRRVGT